MEVRNRYFDQDSRDVLWGLAVAVLPSLVLCGVVVLAVAVLG
jgi:hypothetical protein